MMDCAASIEWTIERGRKARFALECLFRMRRKMQPGGRRINLDMALRDRRPCGQMRIRAKLAR
jgi:hypothetical protein